MTNEMICETGGLDAKLEKTLYFDGMFAFGERGGVGCFRDFC